VSLSEPSGDPPTDPDDVAGDRAGARAGAALAALRAAVDEPWDWRTSVWAPLRRWVGPERLPWLIAAVALAALGAGSVVVVAGGHAGRRGAATGSSAPWVPVTGGAASAPPATSGGVPTSVAGLVVQVAGAVAKPGVFHLAPGSRVADLIAQAGGLAPDADPDRVNQAAALVDGTMVYVPRVGQVDVPEPAAGGGSSAGPVGTGPGQDGSASGPIDLNTASATDLDALPGVGPATAAAIVSYRHQHGPFQRVDDLAGVSGIGPAKLAQIRPHVRV
jgi:competence protein ComEA